MKVAYSYIRFSTPEQMKGDSLRRQLEASRKYAAEHDLVLDDTLRDLGKSVEVAVYPNADHAFFNDTRPAVYNEDAAADAWKRVLDLFRRSL